MRLHRKPNTNPGLLDSDFSQEFYSYYEDDSSLFNYNAKYLSKVHFQSKAIKFLYIITRLYAYGAPISSSGHCKVSMYVLLETLFT